MLNAYLGHREREGWLLHTRIIENEVRAEITDGNSVAPEVWVSVGSGWLVGAAGAGAEDYTTHDYDDGR